MSCPLNVVMYLWIAQIEGRGYNRTGYMFEATGSKNIFQRFLGEIMEAAEERPFFVLEVIATK